MLGQWEKASRSLEPWMGAWRGATRAVASGLRTEPQVDQSEAVQGTGRGGGAERLAAS